MVDLVRQRKFEINTDAWGRVIYEPGDIVGVWGSGITGWANTKFIVPTTPMFHFLLIGDYIPSSDDYVTLESVNKGVTVGRLSWYKTRNYNVYRLNRFNFHAYGEDAFNKASKFGRHGYDWPLAAGLVLTFIRHGFRPLYVDEIPYKRDNKFLCTELVFEAYRLAGVILRDPNHAPLPAEIVLSEGHGEIYKIDHHNAEGAWREKQPVQPHVYEVDRRGADVPTITAPARPNPAMTPTFVGILKRGVHGKRERSHIFTQPTGIPIRACDWIMVNSEDYRPLYVATSRSAAKAPAIHKQMKDALTCENCQLILLGRRRSMGNIFPETYYGPAGGGGGGVG